MFSDSKDITCEKKQSARLEMRVVIHSVRVHLVEKQEWILNIDSHESASLIFLCALILLATWVGRVRCLFALGHNSNADRRVSPRNLLERCRKTTPDVLRLRGWWSKASQALSAQQRPWGGLFVRRCAAESCVCIAIHWVYLLIDWRQRKHV